MAKKKRPPVKKKTAKRKAGKTGTARKATEPALFEADTQLPAALKRLALRYCEDDTAANRAKNRAKQSKLLCIESMKDNGFSTLKLPDIDTVLEVTVTDGLRRRKPKKKKGE